MNPKEKEIISLDKKIMSPSYDRDTDFVFNKGRGVYAFDYSNKSYLDFAAGIAVLNAGHSNDEIVNAIKAQLMFGTHAAFPDFYAAPPLALSKNILSLMPSKSLNKIFLSNSGTESVECAMKLSKYHSKKKWIAAFTPCFHGRTMGSLSMTNSRAVQTEGFGPFLPVEHVPYPEPYHFNGSESDCGEQSLAQVEKVFRSHKSDVAGIFFEPISGEGGYIVPPKNFAKGLKKLCNEFGVLLCVDEVQSGCFRTGSFLAISNFGVVPDIVSLSKAIGGGLPLGATIASKKIMDWPKGAHSNTFGGNLLACAAGNASLNFLKKNNSAENAKKVGAVIMKRLNEMKDELEIIGDVRGLGLMIGIELVESKNSKKPAVKAQQLIIKKAYQKGLLMLGAGKSVLRICPPLILNQTQAMQGIDIIEECIKEVK